MKKFKNKILGLDLETVFKQRLSLQSTQRALWSDFRVDAGLMDVTSSEFLKTVYKNWDQERQSEFVTLLGGKNNRGETFKYLEAKLEE